MIFYLMMAEGGEKTEPASAKKKQDARKKGQVKKSQDLNSAVILLALFATLKGFSNYIGTKSAEVFVDLYSGIKLSVNEFSLDLVSNYFIKVLGSIIMICAPIFIVTIVVSILINILQVGFLKVEKALTPKFSRLNPLTGLKRLISPKALVQLIKSAVKVFIIGYVIYDVIRDKTTQVPYLMTYDILDSMSFMLDVSMDLALRIGLYLLIFAVADYFYQSWQYEKDLKMTKQEVKDEYKQLEGDPQIKGQIKAKQREVSQRRMMQAVPEADVVITNPTHYAIALKYDSKVNRAPVVVAKGKDLVAQKIKQKARESKVEIVENKLLAQTLYKTTDIGKQIPEDLYKAVAEILAQVYRLKKR